MKVDVFRCDTRDPSRLGCSVTIEPPDSKARLFVPSIHHSKQGQRKKTIENLLILQKVQKVEY